MKKEKLSSLIKLYYYVQKKRTIEILLMKLY